MMNTRTRGGPLQGIRVLELTKVWAGPCAGKQLAFLGAEVIRVESLGSLDVTRSYGVKDINKAPGFMAVNPQKLSVQIDMKTEEGIALILELAAKSDILIENLRPGAIDRLGLGYERVKAVNPGLIYVSMGMYGNDGPLSYQTGYAPCFAALGGVSYLVGQKSGAPQGMNVRYADSTFGTAAAYAATVALLHRRVTGRGQFVDVSAVECMSSMVGDALVDYALNQRIEECDGNRHREAAPHGVYPCKDGAWLSIAVMGEAQWQALLRLMTQPEPPESGALASEPRFASLAGRKAHEDELDRCIADWTVTQDADELACRLQQAGVPAAKSLSSLDLVADSTLWARGFYRHVDSAGESRPVVGPSWRMSREAAINTGAPRLGEHNDYILGEVLGLSPQRRAALADSGVTR